MLCEARFNLVWDGFGLTGLVIKVDLHRGAGSAAFTVLPHFLIGFEGAISNAFYPGFYLDGCSVKNLGVKIHAVIGQYQRPGVHRQVRHDNVVQRRAGLFKPYYQNRVANMSALPDAVYRLLHNAREIVDAEQIQAALDRFAVALTAHLQDKNPLVIALLPDSAVMLGTLMHRLSPKL